MPMGKKKLGIFSIFGRQKPATPERSPLPPTREPTVATASATQSLVSAPSEVSQSHAGAVFQIVLDGSPREQMIVPQGMLAEPAKNGRRQDGPAPVGRRSQCSVGRSHGRLQHPRARQHRNCGEWKARASHGECALSARGRAGRILACIFHQRSRQQRLAQIQGRPAVSTYELRI